MRRGQRARRPTSAPCQPGTVSSAPTATTRTRTHRHGRRPHALGPRALGPPHGGPRWIPPHLPTTVQAPSSRRIQTRFSVSRKSTCNCQKIRNPPPPNTKMAPSRACPPSRAPEESAAAGSLAAALLRGLPGECPPAVAAARRLTHCRSSAYPPGSAGPGAAALDGAHGPVGAPSAPGAHAGADLRAAERPRAASAAQTL